MRFQAVLGFIFIVSILGLDFLLRQPPAPLPATAPVDVFAAARAMQHVEAIARRPHPMGSPENGRVRDYLIEQFQRLGLQPEILKSTVEQKGRVFPVENLIVRMAGSGKSNQTFAFAGHYDSVAEGSGASDDTAAVATFIETARALRQGIPLRNDLIFLITDGEEAGLFGARGFVQSSPLAQEIKLVVNFEARGTSGPVYMFETSSDNERLIREFGKAAPYPAASSLMFSIYERMPNDTDLTVFKRAGWTGLNLAFIGNSERYHQPNDDPAHLDHRSLQHQGGYALALARHFGGLEDCALKSEGNAIYFDLFGRWLIQYPQRVVMGLNILTTLLLLGLIAWGFKRQWLSIKKLLGGMLITPAFILISSALTWVLIWLTRQAFLAKPELYPLLRGWGFWWTAIALLVLLLWFCRGWALRWVDAPTLTLTASLWWLMINFLLTAYLPGATYLFTWPLLLAILGMMLRLLFSRNQAPGWLQTASSMVILLPPLLLIAPILPEFYIALGVISLFVAGPLLALMLLLVPWPSFARS